jgi:hypothetical protein
LPSSIQPGVKRGPRRSLGFDQVAERSGGLAHLVLAGEALHTPVRAGMTQRLSLALVLRLSRLLPSFGQRPLSAHLCRRIERTPSPYVVGVCVNRIGMDFPLIRTIMALPEYARIFRPAPGHPAGRNL